MQQAEMFELLQLVTGNRCHLLDINKARKVFGKFKRNRIWNESTQRRGNGVDWVKIDLTRAIQRFWYEESSICNREEWYHISYKQKQDRVILIKWKRQSKAIYCQEYKYKNRVIYLAQNTEITLAVFKLDRFCVTRNDRTKTNM